MKTEAAKYPGVRLLDLHGFFRGHGLGQPSASNWFDDDCIHPNAAGHDAVRRLVWSGLP